jgi:hypothetical protein
MKRGLALLVPLAAALTIGLSACGSGSTTTSTLPGDPVSKAAAATMNAHGARVAIDMKMDIESVGQPFHMTGGGVVDASKRQAQLDLDMSDIANLPGGDQLGAASKLKMRELLDGFTLYMSAPFLTENLPGGKKWLKMDIQKVGQAAGCSLGAFQQPGQGDPSQWIQFLRSASQMKKVGTDTVRGVETTHYKGVSNLDKLPEMVPPADRKAARATTDSSPSSPELHRFPWRPGSTHRGSCAGSRCRSTTNSCPAPTRACRSTSPRSCTTSARRSTPRRHRRTRRTTSPSSRPRTSSRTASAADPQPVPTGRLVGTGTISDRGETAI